MSEPDVPPARSQIGGRHNSPSLTVALPFSKITTIDSALRDAVADLARLVERLAGDSEAEERQTIATAARELADEIASM